MTIGGGGPWTNARPDTRVENGPTTGSLERAAGSGAPGGRKSTRQIRLREDHDNLHGIHEVPQKVSTINRGFPENVYQHMLVMKPLGFYYMFGFVLKPSSEDKLLIFMGIKQDLKA